MFFFSLTLKLGCVNVSACKARGSSLRVHFKVCLVTIYSTRFFTLFRRFSYDNRVFLILTYDAWDGTDVQPLLDDNVFRFKIKIYFRNFYILYSSRQCALRPAALRTVWNVKGSMGLQLIPERWFFYGVAIESRKMIFLLYSYMNCWTPW